jgi:ribosomal protein L7/L12
MALILNQEAQLMFFAKVFGPGHDVTAKVKALVAAGVTFETHMLSLKAKYKDAQYSVSLTKGTTALMKHTVDFAVAEQNRTLISDWVSKLYQTIDVSVAAMTPKLAQALGGGLPKTPAGELTTVVLTGGDKDHLLMLIKAIQTVTGASLLLAKQTAQAALAGTPQYLKTYPLATEAFNVKLKLEAAYGKVLLVPSGAPSAEVIADLTGKMASATASVQGLAQAFAAKPVDAVISLKDAKALGQKVHGTSSGSVYYCVALTEHVKVAARLYETGGISIRAEWTDNPTAELKKLEESGVQMKPSHKYGSYHFDAGDVPLPRVIGAFLMGTGIAWKAVVVNGADLVIGGKS